MSLTAGGVDQGKQLVRFAGADNCRHYNDHPLTSPVLFHDPEALPLIQAKKLKALGITAARRNPSAPQIPTMAEAGLPGYEFTTWEILAAPKATPAPIIATLNEKVRAVLKTPDAVQRWQDRGFDVIASTPDEMTAHLNREIKKWRVVFKEQGIKAE